MTNTVFLDASFWVVYRNEDEIFNPLARRIVMELFRQKTQMITTLPVVCEIHAQFARRALTQETILNDLFENPVVTVEEISRADKNEAITILRSNTDKTYSLCDALSFAVMRRLNIRRSVSFDKHFRQFGEFEIIPNKFP